MAKYKQQSFLPQHMEIHWFSIINSSVLVLLLLGILVTIFMRVLKHDFAKFSRDEEMGDEAEETGAPSLALALSLSLSLPLALQSFLRESEPSLFEYLGDPSLPDSIASLSERVPDPVPL